ncbi:MAG: hypothetical protein WC575_02500 [Patescibacteria group bacterium]
MMYSTPKTGSFAVWQGIVEDVRTAIQQQQGHIYIPDLRLETIKV